ncbi:MAG: Do family serine endopeptidase [Gammaproteobacteria bacterium]|nr:MAG: Do family serine endopeptidase [Gammaproteobacteria bacterium]
MVDSTKITAPRIWLRWTWIIVISLGANLLIQPVFAALPIAMDGREMPSLAPMLERVTPAVVNIATRGRIKIRKLFFDDPFFQRFFDLPNMPQEQRVQSLGSGVVMDAKKGYIVTNHHVIEYASEIRITFKDGRQVAAEVIGSDPQADVAVLRVPVKGLTLKAIKTGNSDQLRVGDFVVAIGNPFRLGQTVTSGIVSALGRSGLGIEEYEDFIQTDASINPGNSGGALVNLRGELIGINTAIYSPGQTAGNIGIGFAIPVNMVRQLVQQIVKYGEVKRGQLGVGVQDLNPMLAEALGVNRTEGAVISSVARGSPAQRAGLMVGDVVLEINGRPMRNGSEMRNAIGLLRIGDQSTIKILRNGKERTIRAVIARTNGASLDAGKYDRRLAGLVMSDIDEGSPLYGRIEGVLIDEIKPGSRAASAGLDKGDVIKAINKVRVRNVNDAVKILKRKPNQLLFNLQRGRSAFFVLLR